MSLLCPDCKIMGLEERRRWTDMMHHLLITRRSVGISSGEALSFILREGFGCDFYTTRTGLIRIKPKQCFRQLKMGTLKEEKVE